MQSVVMGSRLTRLGVAVVLGSALVPSACSVDTDKGYSYGNSGGRAASGGNKASSGAASLGGSAGKRTSANGGTAGTSSAGTSGAGLAGGAKASGGNSSTGGIASDSGGEGTDVAGSGGAGADDGNSGSGAGAESGGSSGASTAGGAGGGRASNSGAGGGSAKGGSPGGGASATGGAAATGGAGGPSSSGGAGGPSSSGGAGGSASGSCSQTLCNGVCLNTAINKDNCGTCGHACRFSASSCVQGACQPIVLATTLSPTQLAQDNNYVYWLDEGSDAVQRAAKDGSTTPASPEFVAGTLTQPTAIAISGNALEWAQASEGGAPGELMYMLINPSGPPRPAGVRFIDSGVNRMITAGGGRLYFTLGHAVMWANASGASTTNICGPNTTCTTQDPIGLAADASNLYFTDIWTGPRGGRVLKIPLDGGTAVPLVTNADFPSHVAVYGSSVYYQSGSDVMRVAIDGLTLPVAISTGTGGGGIVADSSGVYWVNNSNSVYKLPVGATSAVTVATSQGEPGFIIADAGTLYWTNHSTGTVMAVAK